MLKTAALTLGPKLLGLGGSNIRSGDPYAVDHKFLKSLFTDY